MSSNGLQSLFLRHQKIHSHQIGWRDFVPLDALVIVTYVYDVIACRFQELVECRAERRIIVNEEYPDASGGFRLGDHIRPDGLNEWQLLNVGYDTHPRGPKRHVAEGCYGDYHRKG